MSELRLAANYVDFSDYWPFENFGHLQIVYVAGTTQTEIEVQQPFTSGGINLRYEAPSGANPTFGARV
jgi:hypothetical protein